jgi:predicted nucleic acid-binding protein
VKGYVVDASVAIKWFVPEEFAGNALRLLARRRIEVTALHVPDLLFCEVGNILWKKHRRGELSVPEVHGVIEALASVAKTSHACEPLLSVAAQMACEHGRTVYDCVYLALAFSLNLPLVTADRRLYNGITGTPWQPLVKWVGDV